MGQEPLKCTSAQARGFTLCQVRRWSTRSASSGIGRRPVPAKPRPRCLEQRAGFAPAGRLYPIPDDVQVTVVDAGGVPAYWLMAPGADPGRVLLFVHGGGYQLGSLRSYGELAARLGRASRMRILFPEYRLAPEHPFPAAFEDVLASWRWLRADQDLGAASLAVAGDSAGGELSVALLVALRDTGEQLPSATVLLSSEVDLTFSGASMTERADQDPIFTPAVLRQLAASLAGLPPLLGQLGAAELLLSDAEHLAARAAQARVDVIVQVGEGLPHVYQSQLGTPEAAEATEQIGNFLRARLH